MEFRLSQLGNIQREAEEARQDYARAIWTGTKRRGDAFKDMQRAGVVASGIRNARRVSKTWRGQIYPQKFNGTMSPAYVLSNKVPYIFESLEKGTLIRFKGGAGLIPVGPARRVKLAIGESRVSIVAKMRAQYGEFSSFRTAKGVMLGVWQKTPKGKAKFLALFKIVAQVKSPDLLDAEGIAKRFLARHEDELWVEISRLYDEYQGRRGR